MRMQGSISIRNIPGISVPQAIPGVRTDFPALDQTVHGKPLAYLDNASTTQKPRQVIDAITKFYTRDCSNIHRGVHQLSMRATDAYEGARESVRHFINAQDSREIIFVRGTTEGINLVATCFAGLELGEGDEILITAMEHHSNIVPWQRLCQKTGASLKVVPINDRGELNIQDLERWLTPRVKLFSFTHISNALGTINPIARMITLAHKHNIPVLVDGAQAVAHVKVDVQALDSDFYIFSSHKMFGPDGVGALYGKMQHMEKMAPYQSGGDMIKWVTFEKTIFNDIPYRFEAGTPNISGAIGFASAIDYLNAVGLDVIHRHEDALLQYAVVALEKVPGLHWIGTAEKKAGILSFVLEGVHPHDIGTILDQEGVAIRTGHHCAQPVMAHFGVPATARASLALYNTQEDIDALVRALQKVREVFN